MPPSFLPFVRKYLSSFNLLQITKTMQPSNANILTFDNARHPELFLPLLPERHPASELQSCSSRWQIVTEAAPTQENIGCKQKKEVSQMQRRSGVFTREILWKPTSCCIFRFLSVGWELAPALCRVSQWKKTCLGQFLDGSGCFFVVHCQTIQHFQLQKNH